MHNIARKIITFDIEKCSLGEKGVQDFWWPFGAEELRNFSDDAMHLYTNLIHQFDAEDSIEFHPYRLSAKCL